MKRKSISIFIILAMTLVLAISLSSFTTFAAEGDYQGVVVASGSCGTNVNYDIYRVDADNYTLVISGNGDMADYTSSSTKPWADYATTELYVEDGVDSIGAEMRVHELPWPKEELLGLGEKEVELRVTLSYFIEPNPGERGWTDKVQYQS